MRIGRRATTLGGLSAALTVATAADAQQQQIIFFRIGTGGQIGTYFPIGGLIANAISNPPGSRACDDGGSCGVPGLIATAVATGGSQANVLALASGRMQSAFIQSDIAHWAQTATGLYSGKARVEELRAIANLYPESIHVVTRKDSGIATIGDLKGRRVSLDEQGSGTLADARLVLAAYGLSESDVHAEYLKSRPAGEKLQAGQLDAFFSVSGWPEGAIAELAAASEIGLVPIAGPQATALVDQHGFFSFNEIPSDTYRNVPATKTIGVNAVWVTTSKHPEDLIYQVTAALWHPSVRRLLDSGHAKARSIRRESAITALGIPLHPGAQRYYAETRAR
jgi:TRAP transporter TAXI family solute receptor